MKKWLSLCLALLMLSTVAGMAQTPAEEAFNALWSVDTQAINDLWLRLDDAAQSQLMPETLADLKGQLEQVYGPWQKNGETTFVTSSGMRVYKMPVYLERMALQFQLVLQGETIMGLAFTPLAVAPAAQVSQPEDGIQEIDVVIGEGTDYPLPGTLTLPRGGTDLPLAVLVHGSGPNDRNESVGATQMFKDLAWALAERGIASIRYDKRTLVYGAAITQEQLKAFTVMDETIEDALFAARLAQTLEGIDKDRIFVIGHSLGAMLAPRIVSQSQGLFKGMVLLSGSPRTLRQIIIDQNQSIVDSLPENVKAQQQASLDSMIEEAERILSLPEAQLKNESIFGQPAYYFYEMERYDASHLIAQLALPTLIINGGSDFQVTDANGYLAWQTSLEENEQTVLLHEPELNHLLMRYTGDPAYQGSLQEYNTTAELDANVARTIVKWLLAQ